MPFFIEKILPKIIAGKNVLVVAHGNSLRALMIYIESIQPEKVPQLEMLFGGIVLYDLDTQGHMLTKEVRQVESTVNA